MSKADAATPDAPHFASSPVAHDGMGYGGMFDAHRREGEVRRGYAAGLAGALSGFIQPRSVIDLGCGLGFFLSAMSQRGATEIRAVDGDWIAQQPEVEIDRASYVLHDLEQPYRDTRRYDLASCLEVGEHLTPARSEGLVADLVALSDWVLFSAAVPGQGGRGHIALRWQSEWAEMFAAHGYACHDPFRHRLAGVPGMAPWFAQNLLLYIRDGAEMAPELAARMAEHRIPSEGADMILPHYHKRVVTTRERRFRDAVAQMRAAGLRYVPPRKRDEAAAEE